MIRIRKDKTYPLERRGPMMKGTAIIYEEDHVVACVEDIRFTDVEKYRNLQFDESPCLKSYLTIWHPEEIDWEYGY